MKNKIVLLIIISLLALSACGQTEYPTGAMTDDATLTLTWDGDEIVLDAVTLATLVTTELYYDTQQADGTVEEEVSVVFDLLKYLAGEGWELGSCRTWVLTDRQGKRVFVPADQAADSLYIGITDGAKNLDYPVSVIPEGPVEWQVWDLYAVDFRVEKAEALAEEAEREEEAARQQQARDAVEGTRHIALAQGITCGGSLALAGLISENMPEPPAGEVTALTSEEEEFTFTTEQVLDAEYSKDGTVIGEKTVMCMAYGRQAIWLGGPVYPPALFKYCGMIEAEDYTFFAASGANVKLTPKEADQSVVLENEYGGLTLVYPSGNLEGLVSVTAGQPVIDEGN